MILILGGAGFVGRAVVRRLLDKGHQATIVDSLDERVHKGREPDIPEGASFLRGEVGDLPYAAFMDAEIVIHLAAQVSVADSAADPVRYLDQNTIGTAYMLLDLRRARRLRRIVVASSMSVYGEGGTRVKEDDSVNPTSVYGLSKYDQERLCLMWSLERRMSCAALRFFNVYGPGQALDNPYTGVLANFARRLLDDEPPVVFEDGSQTRDFIYIDDVADAVCTVALSDKPVNGAYNVCTGESTSVLRAAQLLGHALNKSHIEPHITNQKRPGDIRHCTGNPDKLARHFGWSSRTPFELGIKEYGRDLLKRVAV